MEATVAENHKGKAWDGGGAEPFSASYGKMMMWFFIVSDALTFSGFLGAYGLMRFKFYDTWPIADEVFTHFPFIHGHYPMYYVAFMTFVPRIGCCSVVFEPMMKKHLASSNSVLELVLAPLPNAAARPATVGLCQRRAQ